MIRINLLPIKQDRRKEAGRNHIAIGILVIVLEIVLLFILSFNKSNEVTEMKNKNSALEAKITRIKQDIAGHEKILAQLQEYEQRQAAVEELLAGRTGPVQVMLELSRVLSKGGKPTLDPVKYQEIIKENSARGYDENWDYRRVWLVSFTEKDKHITIKGQGVTHEDVAEFLRRISLSSFFVSSELVSTKLGRPTISSDFGDIKSAADVVSFTLVGDIRYR